MPLEIKNIYKKNIESTQTGFSIIEVLVTLFIIGITLLLFAVVSNAIVLNKYNRYKEIALRVAETKLAELRTTPHGNLPTSGTFSNSQVEKLPQGNAAMAFTEVATGLTQATVTVTWQNTQNTGTQEISLSTYISQFGLGK